MIIEEFPHNRAGKTEVLLYHLPRLKAKKLNEN